MARRIEASRLISKPLIISVSEVRKLLGKSSETLSDHELTSLINDYEVLARQAVREYLARKQVGNVLK